MEERKDEIIEEAVEESEKLTALRESLLADLSNEVIEKLDKVYTDAGVCQVLADAGVDLEGMEKKIEAAGLNMKRVGLQLSDDNLAEVSGGFHDDLYEGNVWCCNCGATERDDFSKQFWKSMFTPCRVYRCKKCNSVLAIYKKSTVIVYDNMDEFDRKANPWTHL